MITFTEHRGSLEEAMNTKETLDDMDSCLESIHGMSRVSSVSISQPIYDDRTKCNRCCVVVNGYGVVGYIHLKEMRNDSIN